jgi:hypothetical protein
MDEEYKLCRSSLFSCLRALVTSSILASSILPSYRFSSLSILCSSFEETNISLSKSPEVGVLLHKFGKVANRQDQLRVCNDVTSEVTGLAGM